MNARLDWLILFLGTEGGPYRSDRFRIMKGMFLLSNTTGHPTGTLYHFKPYDFGPIEPGIDHDLDTLQLTGLVRRSEEKNPVRWFYSLSEEGWAVFHALSSRVPVSDLPAVRPAKELATSLDAEELINHLYREFPEFLVEYARTEGKIEGNDDGTINVVVYELAPAPRKTSTITILKVDGNVTVRTDLGNHLGLELRIPVGD